MTIDGPERFDDRVVPAGRVKVAAWINKTGRVEGAKVLESDRAKLKEGDVLEAHVISHLNTWRFEPSSRSDEFTVTYRYIIDSEIIMPVIEVTSVNEVTIRANPGITTEEFRRLVEKGRR